MNSLEKRSKLCLNTLLQFADWTTLLRIRNLSKKARKAVRFVLKHKKVRLSSFSQRALALNNLVYLGKRYSGVDCPEQLMPGVADYRILSKYGIQRLRAVSPEMHCSLMVIYKIEPVQFGNVSVLEVKQSNFKFYEDLGFQRVDCLKIKNLSAAQTQAILGKIQILKELIAETSEIWLIPPRLQLVSMTLINSKVKTVNVVYTLKELNVNNSTGLNSLKCPNLVKLEFESPFSHEKTENWLLSMKKLKIAINTNKIACLTKHLRYFHNYSLKTELKIVKWAYLVCLDCPLSRVNASSIDSTELKIVNSEILNDWSGMLSSRLRRVAITEGNIEFFCNHPELLYKCSDLQSSQPECLREKLQYLLRKIMKLTGKTVIRVG